jgi:hypothetical protein
MLSNATTPLPAASTTLLSQADQHGSIHRAFCGKGAVLNT